MLRLRAAWALVGTAHACSFLATSEKLVSGEGRPVEDAKFAHVNYHLAFRGPDHMGTAAFGGFSFVHNLLHMTGAMVPQPLISADKTVIGLFNGEIYNYRRLQSELRPNGPPYLSDGECVLEAYKHWGRQFARHLEGEFAIAVFDLSRRRIFVVTDPFGIKPVFVSSSPSSFGVSSYRSGLLRAGHRASVIEQLRANHLHVFRYEVDSDGKPHSFSAGARHQLVVWDVRQHKSNADDWAAAFEEAVRVRTEGAFRGVFLALSSGYDSGAIHLAMLRLGVPHATYSIVGAENQRDVALLKERLAFARSFPASSRIRRRTSVASPPTDAPAAAGRPAAGAATMGSTDLGGYIVHVNASAFRRTQRTLQKKCEPYRYAMPHYSAPKLESPSFVVGTKVATHTMPLLKDSAAMGVAHICSLAIAQGQRTMLTGSGADETMTDYGFGGLRFAPQSQFGGHYPNDTTLRGIFPWENFYGGSQRAFLAKVRGQSNTLLTARRPVWPFGFSHTPWCRVVPRCPRILD